MIPSLSSIPRDARWLVVARTLRLFAYGFLSVVLVFYLVGVGIPEQRIGPLLTLTLVGDTVISLFLTTRADRAGRRMTLIIGALLMTLAGVVFAFTHQFIWLLLAAIVGVISPSGKEVGPFLSVEQAALSHVISGERRTRAFAWYNLVGSFAGAFGVLFATWMTQGFTHAGASALTGYRAVVLAYAGVGVVLAILFAQLGKDVEAEPGETVTGAPRSWTGLTHSRSVVLRLSGLFIIDSFAGGFVIDSLTIFWFHTRFGVDLAVLGWVYFATNAVAGFSGLWAARLAERFGLVNTMVFTHLPSNILLILVPLMPNLPLAALVLILRFSISQMDVPTRQAYTMAIVRPAERSAAAGVTGTARTIGAALAPMLATLLYGSRSHPALASVPFFIAGGLKILYDVLLYRSFQKLPTDLHGPAPAAA